MRHFRPVVLTLLLACHAAAPAPAPPVPLPTSSFADLLARAEAGDTTLDFEALRLSYTTTPLYEPYGMRDRSRQDSLIAALDRDSLGAATTWSDSLLADNPVTPEGQAITAYLFRMLGDSARADHHHWMAYGLMRSIEGSGVGTNAEPYLVIAIYEEYAFARYLGLERLGTQGLGTCGGRPCDSVGFKDPASGRDTTLYFDVSIPFGHLERTFKK